MKNIKAKVVILVGCLIFIASVQSGVAANQYSVKVGAHFRWDATKYYYVKDVTAYTHDYYLEFNFTNWAGVSGAEYLNGTVNNNGTIYDGEISHMYYYGGQSFGQEWVTEILDYQGSYPIHIYLVSNTEIEQTTKPDLQNLAANSWLNFDEISTNNFTLTGTYIDGDDTAIYTGKVEFNSDKVLLHVYDELEQKTLGVTQIIERYEWTLTYTPGSGDGPNGETGGMIPGFPLYTVIAAIAIGLILIIRKKHIYNIKTN